MKIGDTYEWTNPSNPQKIGMPFTIVLKDFDPASNLYTVDAYYDEKIVPDFAMYEKEINSFYELYKKES